MKSVFFLTFATVASASISLPDEPVVYAADVFPARNVVEEDIINVTLNNVSGPSESILKSTDDMEMLEDFAIALLAAVIESEMGTANLSKVAKT